MLMGVMVRLVALLVDFGCVVAVLSCREFRGLWLGFVVLWWRWLVVLLDLLSLKLLDYLLLFLVAKCSRLLVWILLM